MLPVIVSLPAVTIGTDPVTWIIPPMFSPNWPIHEGYCVPHMNKGRLPVVGPA